MHDIVIIFNTFRDYNNPLLGASGDVYYVNLPFSSMENPFGVNNSNVDLLRSTILEHKNVIDTEDKLLKITKGKNVLADKIHGEYEDILFDKLDRNCNLTVFDDLNYILSDDQMSNLDGRFSFSKFRKKIETVALVSNNNFITGNPYLSSITDYFENGQAHYYFETRNALCGDMFSTRLSKLLHIGLVHPVEVINLVENYEKEMGANKSTYWIKFELLWREYFYWLYKKNKNIFFKSKGFDGGNFKLQDITIDNYLTNMNKNPLIKAMNKELMETGFLSNRSRQIYASYLINCTNLDWRYGAWFFQLYLLDYDLYSNWGNWLYLSGYGTDSKGPRFFNIVKQMKNYDPDLDYLKLWQEFDEDSWSSIDNTCST